MLFLLLVGLLHGGDAQHICQWTSPLNDVDRSLFVDIHNTYRAYVARGEAYQLNGKLPGSTRLFELKYDCQLELMAQMNTYSCNQTFHPPTTSMNYFTIANEPLDWDEHDLIPMAVSSWYQPVLNFGIDVHDDESSGTTTERIDVHHDWSEVSPGTTTSTSTFPPSPAVSPLESFANMMYYKSLKFGCSRNICPSTATTPSMVAIACVYSSAAQRFDQIYIPGRYGCAENDDCTNSGVPFKCIKDGPYRGLCSQDKNVTMETTTTPAPETSSEPWWKTTEEKKTSSRSWWDTTSYGYSTTRRPWWDTTPDRSSTTRWPWWYSTASYYWDSNAINKWKLSPPEQLLDNDVKEELHNSQ
ncbi:hypothetical protein GCK32_009414 [Trichostrongylus colubriformis]|uniref:SCP domain-containing protein n=1 Tax=Trichostrongylus colubriformis TaxID=6319 RepID=A0AAN8ERH0_TRICO